MNHLQQFQGGMQRGREGGFLHLACDAGLILAAVLWMFVQAAQLNLVLPADGDAIGWSLFVLRLLISVVLALGCAVVLPALLAIIVPFTPAGQLLQEIRRTTWGFLVMVGVTGYLLFYGFGLFQAYWYANLSPELVAADSYAAIRQTITTLIIGVVVPALAFSWSSPLAWAAEVQQAHQVKKLRLMHEAEIAMAKAAYFRAVDKLRVGLVNLSAGERAEVIGIMAGLQRSQNDTLQAIAGTFKTIAGAELAAPTLDDQTIVKCYDELAGLLESRVLDVVDVPAVEAPHAPRELAAPATPFDRTAPERQTVAVAPPARSTATAPPVAPQGPQGAARATIRAGTVDQEALSTAWMQLRSGAWTRERLQQVLSCSKTKANQLIAQWTAAGYVVELTDARYHYTWTEHVPEVSL